MIRARDAITKHSGKERTLIRNRYRVGELLAVLSIVTITTSMLPSAAHASAPLVGSGSSFAGIEFQQWTQDVARPPYLLNVNYQSSSSGAGRQQFRDHVVDFGVSDIRYTNQDGAPPPADSFIYIPVTAGGLSFMYNLKKHGLDQNAAPIKLSDYTACGIFTAGIKKWNDPAIQQDNPGVQLPDVPITPVVRADPSGTNFVLEEYCIAKQPNMYFAFVDAAGQAIGQNGPHYPTSTWLTAFNINAADGSDGVANVVAGPNNDGYITAVETGYAAQRSFPVAAVQNNSGNFVLPTEPNVFAALSYATQQTDGTHTLNFSPPDPNAYNPSTYSYLLAPITTQYLPVDKGAALTQFLDYALTFGQAEANRLKYASIGHALITYGLDASKKIPGYVGPTPEELAAIPPDPATGQANPTNAAAIGTVASTPAGPGGTTSSGGSSGGGAATAPGGQGSAGSGAATAGAPGSKTSSSASRSLPGRTSRALAGGARTSGAGSLGPDASVSLDPAVGAFAQTGGEQGLLAAVAALVVVAATGARRFARRRQTT